MQKRWCYAEQQQNPVFQQAIQQLNLHPIVSNILINKGYQTLDEIKAFLNAPLTELRDPYLLRGMKEGVACLSKAILEDQRIVILGDYDVDGVTATTILLQYLEACGCSQLQYFIPNRIEHGYGLTSKSTDVLLSMTPELVITVDNGITAKEEVQRLKQHGVTTLITDHHLGEVGQVAEGIVINPNHPECDYPFKGISGCGVALKLIMASRKTFREQQFWNTQRPEPNIKYYFDLAALGTVADVVPLIDENRLIVQHGLQVMNQFPSVGIRALKQQKRVQEITSRTLGFQFGPLINAAGRLQDASIGVELLRSQSPTAAAAMATQLDSINTERRHTEHAMLQVAMSQVEEKQTEHSIIVASPDFHEGVSGIVAARLTEKFYRPSLVLAKNGETYKGSARSIPEIHVKKVLNACSEYLDKFGGHAGAAGFSLHEAKLTGFKTQFEKVCQEHLPEVPQPQLQLESKLDYSQITESFIQQLNQLQPFGAENPEPLFAINCPQEPFEVLKEVHVKWRLGGSIEIIGWNLAEAFFEKKPQQLAVSLGINEFQGRRKLQLLIQDYQE